MSRPRKNKSNFNFDDEYDASVYDDFFSELISDAKKDYPGNIYSGGEEAGLLICLPLPALSLRYLFQQDGWPLGRFVMLVGEQESCKSSFLYEIIRWHRQQNGFGVIIDTEFKPAPDLLWSILNYDYKSCAYLKCKTLDNWMYHLSDMIKRFKEKMDEKNSKSRGRTFPICFGIDSLMAALDEKEYERLAREGIPENRYAVGAKMLNDYMKQITKELDEFPFTMVGINHLKPSVNQQGIPVRNIAGGKSLRFHQAMEIEMKRKSSTNPSSKNQIRRIEGDFVVEGIELQISVMKNSNAPHEYITVEMLWYVDLNEKVQKKYVDPKSGEEITVEEHPQKTWFDWHASTTEVLLQITKEKSKQAQLLKDVIQIEGGADRRYCWSPTLGVPESDKISWREMGILIENKIQSDPSFRDALYPVLGIRRRFPYKPGVDYRELIRQASNLALKESGNQDKFLLSNDPMINEN